MNYPLRDETVPDSVSERASAGAIRVISTFRRHLQLEVLAHVEPHAHATAQLARHFADACRTSGRSDGPTPEEIELGAYLHDIGKYWIPPSVLLKPAALDEEERAIVCRHPEYGATAVSKLPGATEVIRQAVLHHHEHWNGGGYPGGLSGTRIPLVARIISVVDVYTSLRARRSYKSVRTKEQAFSTLIVMAGCELDPCLVEDFLVLVKDKKLPTQPPAFSLRRTNTSRIH